MSPAPEPEDVQWENLALSFREKSIRVLVGIGVLFIYLIVCIVMVGLCSRGIVEKLKTYPNVDCHQLLHSIPSSVTLQNAAIDDWNTHRIDPSYKLNGALQCFCDMVQENQGQAEYEFIL